MLEKIRIALIILAGIIHLGCETTNNPFKSVDIPKRDTIPFILSPGNNLIFQTILNETDTLNLFFDTGGTDLVLTNKSIKAKLGLEQDGEPSEPQHTLSIGPFRADSMTIYPVPNGPADADGHFGWNLFKNQIIEINYDDLILVIHSSLDTLPEDFHSFPIEYSHTLFCISGTMQVGDQSFTDRYLFDSGFQRGLLLDRELRMEKEFPEDLPILKETKLTNSEGQEFINRIVPIDLLCFDALCLDSVPAFLISTPNPARFKTHILGNELLKRFNTILDFKKGFVYLNPNTLSHLPFADSQ